MPPQRIVIRRIDVLERARIVAGIPLRVDAPAPLLLIGDGGVASHELGEVVGVCAEAPLARVIIREKKHTLDGVGGIASTLRHWGAAPVVACPEGSGHISSLQRSLLTQEGIGRLRLSTGLRQITRYTQRVFAGGHQFTHLETDEEIPPSRPAVTERGYSKLLQGLADVQLLGIVDSGNAGLGAVDLSTLLKRAERAGIPVFYEPRTVRLLPLNRLAVIKVNDNQMRQWFGAGIESDAEARTAAQKMMASTGADNIIYTRGERGILLCQRTHGAVGAFLIEPQEKKLFDLVSVGDFVTAALLFCMSNKRSLLEAVCFAATAAEYGLDRRYSKRLDLNSIYRLPNHK